MSYYDNEPAAEAPAEPRLAAPERADPLEQAENGADQDEVGDALIRVAR